MSEGEIKELGDEKSCKWRGKGWRMKDTGDLVEDEGKEEGFGMKVTMNN